MPLAHVDKIRPKTPNKIRGAYKTAVNGGEMQANWNMGSGATGWVGSNATVDALTDRDQSAVLITSTGSGANERGELTVSGLTIGLSYKISIVARRGVGTTQTMRSFSWCAFIETAIDTGDYATYTQTVVATETTGISRVFATSGGSTGDQVYVSQVSIREV